MGRADPLVLVAEISHRVVNEYALAIAGIRVVAQNAASIEVREILGSTAARLHAFAEAHRALQAPRPDKEVDVTDYLKRLCETLTVAFLRERGVHLTLNAHATTLSAGRCWRVALVVSELITNCVRHGLKNGPGNIAVELVPNGSEILCRVIDDGCGSSCPMPGLGLSVVAGLAAELGGTADWEFTSRGTVAELRFPYLSD